MRLFIVIENLRDYFVLYWKILTKLEKNKKDFSKVEVTSMAKLKFQISFEILTLRIQNIYKQKSCSLVSTIRTQKLQNSPISYFFSIWSEFFFNSEYFISDKSQRSEHRLQRRLFYCRPRYSFVLYNIAKFLKGNKKVREITKIKFTFSIAK